MNAATPVLNPPQTILPEIIVEALVAFRGVPKSVLWGPDRSRGATQPRNELILLLREYGGMTAYAIGRMLGSRDQSAILNSLRRMSGRMLEEPGYREEWRKLVAFVQEHAVQERLPRRSAGCGLARRIMIDRQAAPPADVARLALMVLTIGSILSSGDLTDAEARQAALGLMIQGGVDGR